MSAEEIEKAWLCLCSHNTRQGRSVWVTEHTPRLGDAALASLRPEQATEQGAGEAKFRMFAEWFAEDHEERAGMLLERMGWDRENEFPQDFVRRHVKAALKATPAKPDDEAFTFEDAKRMLRGSVKVYGGGYDGIERDAYKAGLRTAVAVLEGAKRGDTQTAANLNIGAWPQEKP